MLVAFEWNSYDTRSMHTFSKRQANTDVEELAQITQQNALPPPPAPSIELNIVENTAQINDDLSNDAEADESI